METKTNTISPDHHPRMSVITPAALAKIMAAHKEAAELRRRRSPEARQVAQEEKEEKAKYGKD